MRHPVAWQPGSRRKQTLRHASLRLHTSEGLTRRPWVCSQNRHAPDAARECDDDVESWHNPVCVIATGSWFTTVRSLDHPGNVNPPSTTWWGIVLKIAGRTDTLFSADATTLIHTPHAA